MKPFQKKAVLSKHKKFGIISGVVILTCALSWIPSTVLYFSGAYLSHSTCYYFFLGLHYLITVTNPIVYILGTQGNVGQALVSTPVQYRRRISRPSMYNSHTLQGSRNRRHGTVRPISGLSGLSGTNSLELIIENDQSSWPAAPHLEKLESVETVLSHIEFDSP